MPDKRSSARYVLLLRGINVNPTTRVSMANLLDILIGLGYTNVRTLLQSGNVLLDSESRPAVAPIEKAIASGTGVSSRVVVLSVLEFRAIATANPLLEGGENPSRLMVTFLGGSIAPAEIQRPSDADLAPERLVITPLAIYQWLPHGVLQSQLKPAWWRQIGPVATARNVRTVDRILAAAED
jgi:uncharacterized protein (DUF1697 family)